MLGPRLGRQSATGGHLYCNVGEEQPGEEGDGEGGVCGKSWQLYFLGLVQKKTPDPTITTDSPFYHDMLERSTSLQARHCAHKCTVVHNSSTVVQGRTSELTAGLGGPCTWLGQQR